MPVRSAPHWWIECDGEGCEDRVPPPTWGEVGVWPSRQDVEADAYDHEWEHTADGAWLCPTCQCDSINYRKRPHLWKSRGPAGPNDIVLHHTVGRHTSGPPLDEGNDG